MTARHRSSDSHHHDVPGYGDDSREGTQIMLNRRGQVELLLGVLLGIGGGAGVLAQPGTLDPSFGVGGYVTTDFGFHELDESETILVQPDGKILVGGAAFAGPSTSIGDFALARYNPDGTLDASFGVGGLVTTDLGSFGEQILDLALQPDGKIVAGGWFDPPEIGDIFDFALARYLPDGTLDVSFGGSGFVIMDISADEIMVSVLVQPDGKIVGFGWGANPGGEDLILTRYHQNGTLDPTFGTGGIVKTNISGMGDLAGGAVLQPDGKIVAVGSTFNGGGRDWALVRYNPDGSLDPSFGAAGIATTNLGGRSDFSFAVALQPDGKFVVVGRTDVGATDDIAVARYNPNGTLDSSFGTGGVVVSDLGSDDEAYAVALQPDGKIVVAGDTGLFRSNDAVVARYLPDGTPDATFGTNGVVISDLGSTTGDSALDVALQRDGKIVTTNHATPTSDFDLDFAVARYNGDPPSACGSDPRALCLGGGRFRVEATFADFAGAGGVAQAVSIPGSDSGLFTFFDPSNWEILVKVLDACGVNQRFWVFAGATTNVEYTLTVTDTVTGARKEYRNSLGVASPAITDTDAFAACSGGTPVVSAAAPALATRTDSLDAACANSATELCVQQGRFRVEVDFRDFENRRDRARRFDFGTADSGLFYFFTPENIEMLVKVLDGCGINQRYWVLAAATTTVEYTLTVTDTESGKVQQYFNPLGEASSAVTDADAFASCP